MEPRRHFYERGIREDRSYLCMIEGADPGMNNYNKLNANKLREYLPTYIICEPSEELPV